LIGLEEHDTASRPAGSPPSDLYRLIIHVKVVLFWLIGSVAAQVRQVRRYVELQSVSLGAFIAEQEAAGNAAAVQARVSLRLGVERKQRRLVHVKPEIANMHFFIRFEYREQSNSYADRVSVFVQILSLHFSFERPFVDVFGIGPLSSSSRRRPPSFESRRRRRRPLSSSPRRC
jgi:hypothetical protein